MVTGRREFRRTTSLTQITVDLTAVKQPVSDFPVTAERKGQEGDSSNSNSMGATESPPRDYTRMRRRSINIPTPRNYYNNTNITYTEDDTCSFLTSCGLCQRRLPPGRDIFMYRGDTAYCSVECREEQMEHDERKEECSSSIHSPSANSLAKDHDLSSHILDHSPTACAVTSDPAAAKPSTVAAA